MYVADPLGTDWRETNLRKQASNVKPTRVLQQQKSAPSPGVFVTYVIFQSHLTGEANDLFLARVPLPLHLEMVKDSPSVPTRQPRLGIPEVRSLGYATKYQTREATTLRVARLLPRIQFQSPL